MAGFAKKKKARCAYSGFSPCQLYFWWVSTAVVALVAGFHIFFGSLFRRDSLVRLLFLVPGPVRRPAAFIASMAPLLRLLLGRPVARGLSLGISVAGGDGASSNATSIASSTESSHLQLNLQMHLQSHLQSHLQLNLQFEIARVCLRRRVALY